MSLEVARRFEAVRAQCERRASDTSWPEARKRLQANEVYRTIPNTMHNVEFVDYTTRNSAGSWSPLVMPLVREQRPCGH